MSDWSIGATYWPRRKGIQLWTTFDRGETRDEFQQIADAGINTVRLPLYWEDFQPQPERVSSNALRALEQILELVEHARLGAVPTLWPVAIAGAIHVPDWATAASYAADLTLSTKFGPLLIVQSETRSPIVWQQSNHNTQVRDLWTNPAMLDAQRKLISEVIGYFGDHPVIRGWEMGSGIELARIPASSDATAEWLGQINELARQHGARGTLFYGATLRALLRREGPRPAAMKEAGIVPAIDVIVPDPMLNHEPLTAEFLQFIAALVHSLGGDPPALIIGAPSIADAGAHTFTDQAYGRTIQQPLLDLDAYAQLVQTALSQLQVTGAAGVWFAHTYCYAQPFVPTEAHSRRDQMMGLWDIDGRELPVAEAVRRVGQQPAPTETVMLPVLDVEDYWADPITHFRRLWQQWQTTDK
jgi:hypothetical protein